MTDKPLALIYLDTFVSGVSSWSRDLIGVHELARERGYEVGGLFIRDSFSPDCFERMLEAVRRDAIPAVFTPQRSHIGNGDRVGVVTALCDLVTLRPQETIRKVAGPQ